MRRVLLLALPLLTMCGAGDDGGIGAPCRLGANDPDNDGCAEELVCANDWESGHCSSGRLGEPCGFDPNDAGISLTCIDSVCGLNPDGPGLRCIETECFSNEDCDDGLVCSLEVECSSTCTTAAGPGETCESFEFQGSPCLPLRPCAPGLTCRSGGVCG